MNSEGLNDDKRVAAANATIDGSLIFDLRAGRKKTMSELWPAFTAWLSKASPEQQYGLLNPPATDDDFEKFREVMHYELPENVKQLYRMNNGGSNSDTYQLDNWLGFLVYRRTHPQHTARV